MVWIVGIVGGVAALSGAIGLRTGETAAARAYVSVIVAGAIVISAALMLGGIVAVVLPAMWISAALSEPGSDASGLFFFLIGALLLVYALLGKAALLAFRQLPERTREAFGAPLRYLQATSDRLVARD